MSGRDRQQGFTLIEVLIALTLLALMLTVLFSSLYTGSRAWDAGTERTERSGEMMAAQQLLRRIVEAARPLRLIFPSGETVVAFTGSSDRLALVSRSPSAALTEGYYIYTLKLAESPGGERTLVLEVEPWFPGEIFADSDDLAEEVVLHEDVEGMEIRYFGRAEAHETPSWHDDWQGRDAAPGLISIEIRSPAGWPILHAAPLMDRLMMEAPHTADPDGGMGRFLGGLMR